MKINSLSTMTYKKNFLAPILSVATFAVFISPSAEAQISYSTAGSTYSQAFDNLLSPVPANNTTSAATVLPTGWSFVEALGNANTTLRVDNGSSGTGDTYLYGATSSNERAFGAYASGSLTSIFGATLVNNTGTTLTQFTLTFDAEQWKDGGSSTAVLNTSLFSYLVGGTDLTTGTFINISALDLVAKVNNTSSDVTLDGNAAANRNAGVSATVTGLSWADGQNLVFRWSDPNNTGNDDGLAVDNINFTAVPEPSTYLGGGLLLGLAAWSQRRRLGFAA